MTVHSSYENINSPPSPVLYQDIAPETRGYRDPGVGPLTMHCLWVWVTPKAAQDTGDPPPEVPGAHGQELPEPEDCEVGIAAWDQGAFPGSPEWVSDSG